MEYRILGPLEVIEDGKVLDVGGQKQRALLAMLLLEANQVVSSDRLVEAVWEEQPPETAVKALQVYVSQLRKTLGAAHGRDGGPVPLTSYRGAAAGRIASLGTARLLNRPARRA